MPYRSTALQALGLTGLCVLALQSAPRAEITPDDAVAMLAPFEGPSIAGVDTSTLTGKVMCGYQGWFTCPGDGAERGWFHWGGDFRPGSCNVDLWPDVSELDPDERYATAFRHADGSVAEVFSSMNAKTTDRHFLWMEQYGIDGAFVQRFVGETMHPTGLHHCNTVLNHCRQSANAHGRAYAVMYDLSGLGADSMDRVIEDWKRLVDRMRLTRDPADHAYLRHNGKPVVAVWGVGFSDNRKYTLDDCERLVRFLSDDPDYGGCTVMLGVPSWWRTLERDAVNDPKLLEVIRLADIVSPWAVGRYGTPEQATAHARQVWAGDLAWCQANGQEFLPVAFPGFSWHNMNPRSPQNQIPRLGGRFLWSQYLAAREIGATMVYQAMFDEVDEGTAIFKCTSDPPVGESTFVTYEGLPSDHYLRLVGEGGQLIRGEIEPTDELPRR